MQKHKKKNCKTSKIKKYKLHFIIKLNFVNIQYKNIKKYISKLFKFKIEKNYFKKVK